MIHPLEKHIINSSRENVFTELWIYLIVRSSVLINRTGNIFTLYLSLSLTTGYLENKLVLKTTSKNF